jgi:membrane-associated protease RseP (regulator of RpoE activity)
LFSNYSLFILVISTTVPVDYVDSMDVSNYVFVELNKPMGIVFEENDADFGGIFVHSLKENGAAASLPIQVGDQLVAVQKQKVSGLPFDEALNAITTSPDDSKIHLIFFRGRASQFYGPTGASQEWLDELIAGKMSQKVETSISSE